MYDGGDMTSASSAPPTLRTLVIRVFAPFALGYFLSYLLRVVNAVIAPDLVADLGIDAADLGLLTSANFFAFAVFQLPLGILLDRYGSRRVETALLLVCASGCVVFAMSQSLAGLIAGRAMIGLGTSACLMAAFTAYVIWFPRPRLPLVNGCQMMVGGAGALAGTVPIEWLLHFTDWRGVFLLLGAFSTAIAVTIFFVVPRRGVAETSSESLASQFAGVGRVYRSPLFWRVAPFCVSTQGAFLAVQSLWVGPWLSDVGGFEREAVAQGLSLVAATMVVAYIALALIADRLRHAGIGPIRVAACGMITFIVIQGLIVSGWHLPPMLLWMGFGFFGSAGIMAYAGLSQRFPPELAGRVVTGVNVLTFFAAFAMQWGIGVVIDLYPSTADGGYAPEGYRAAFLVLLALQCTTMTWFLTFRRASIN